MPSLLLAVLLAASLLVGAARHAEAREVTIGYLSWEDDPRYDENRIEHEFPTHPAARPFAGAEVGLAESSFALAAQDLEVSLDPVEVADEAGAMKALEDWASRGAVAVVLDLPGEWVKTAAAHLAGLGDKAPLLFNATAPDDELRGAGCHPQLFHTIPNRRMQADALAQMLAIRRWNRVLVLQGPGPADQERGKAFAQAARKFGLKIVATRPFKLSNDPRERDLGNIALLTANADYDAVAVIDADGEFARGVPYQTVLPRPVVGANGLTAQAWHSHFERYGAPQLSKRFRKAAKRPMSSWDWSTWIAVKAISRALTTQPAAQAKGVRDVLRSPETILDGFKGVRLSFRPWDQQLRQPVFLSYGDGIGGIAPFEGFLHQRDTLDTLGFDQPESACKAIGK